MSELTNFGKCPKCGYQHDKSKGHQILADVWPNEIVESCTCIQCGVTFQRKHQIVVSVRQFEVWYDGQEHITIDNRAEKPKLHMRNIDEVFPDGR